jgi:hypothetical protein
MGFILFLVFIPLFPLYLLLALLSPFMRFGRVRRGSGRRIHIVGDLVHSDYLFESKEFPEFPSDSGYVKVGWGDRRIFLETRTWGELRFGDFLRAFFGLNPTVLRLELLEGVPGGSREIEMGGEQLEALKAHVRGSFFGSPIERRPCDYQGGVFYGSGLRYNCVTNCNNWVGVGLRRAGVSNRLWTPLSFWG